MICQVIFKSVGLYGCMSQAAAGAAPRSGCVSLRFYHTAFHRISNNCPADFQSNHFGCMLQAAAGRLHLERGVSLRFPRFIRERTDKVGASRKLDAC